jgi:hypothetical protein
MKVRVNDHGVCTLGCADLLPIIKDELVGARLGYEMAEGRRWVRNRADEVEPATRGRLLPELNPLPFPLNRIVVPVEGCTFAMRSSCVPLGAMAASLRTDPATRPPLPLMTAE